MPFARVHELSKAEDTPYYEAEVRMEGYFCSLPCVLKEGEEDWDGYNIPYFTLNQAKAAAMEFEYVGVTYKLRLRGSVLSVTACVGGDVEKYEVDGFYLSDGFGDSELRFDGSVLFHVNPGWIELDQTPEWLKDDWIDETVSDSDC